MDGGMQNEKTRERLTHRGVFFFPLFFRTEELACRDLCVPVYMKKN